MEDVKRLFLLSFCLAILAFCASAQAEPQVVPKLLQKILDGPLAGVEPELLSRAFEVARAETVANDAELAIETGPVVVECRSCGASGEARVNRLVCPSCDDWKVDLKQGDELLLLRLELSEIST